jgi:Domain of unknown function (DUF1772)
MPPRRAQRHPAGSPASFPGEPAVLFTQTANVRSMRLAARRSATWTADDHPGDWREQQQRWDRLHYARVAIVVVAFMLTLVAAAVA